MKKSSATASLAAMMALSISIFVTTPAQAIEIERQGSCSMGSIFSADLELEYNVWDLGFEVDTRDTAGTWRFIVNQNGNRIFKNRAKAIKDFDDNYGEVEWNLLRPNRAGTDRFFMSAKNLATGEICKVTLRG